MLQRSDLSHKAVEEVYVALHTPRGTIEKKNYLLVMRCFTNPPNVREQNAVCRDRPSAGSQTNKSRVGHFGRRQLVFCFVLFFVLKRCEELK